MNTVKKGRELKKDKVCLVLREKKELIVVGQVQVTINQNNKKIL